MHNQQVGLGGDGEFNRGAGGIDRGGDAGDGAGIFDLEAVDRAVEIRKRF